MNLRTVSLCGSLLLASVLGFLVFARSSDGDSTAPPPSAVPAGPITVEGWQYQDGDLERNDDGSFRTLAGLSLEQLGLEVDIAPGSDFRIEGGVPVVDTGSLEVRADLDADFGPIRIPAGSGLEMRGDEIIVGPGGALVDGTWLPSGTSIPRTRAIAENPSMPRSRAADGEGARTAAGIVVDGATGRPIAGARIRVTISDHPDGDPSISTVTPAVVLTDSAGRFDLPSGPLEAARLWLRIEADAPGYAPMMTRTEEPRTLDGTWPFIEIALRRTWITELDFRLEDQESIPGALVRVVQKADVYIPEDGPLVTREGDEWISLRTADSAGRLPLVRRTESFTLLHPTIVPFPSWRQRPLWAGTEFDDGVTSTGEPEPLISLHIIAPTIETFELVDATGAFLADMPLAVRIPEERRVFRMRTDEYGRFTLGVSDRPPGEPGLLEVPKGVAIELLDPRFQKQELGFFLPGHPERLLLTNYRSPLFSFTLVEELEGSETRPIAAEQVTISADLTLLEATEDGRVVFTGTLPAEGEKLWITARDRLPVEITVAAGGDRASDLDLGSIVLPPGESTPVILHGVSPEDLEGAVLEISGNEGVATRFLYPLEGRSRLTIGGLDPLRFYRFRVTGPWLEESSGEFRLSDDHLEQGLAIPVFSNEPSRVVTRGAVLGIPPSETDRYRVIERGYRENDLDPVIERSYPLAIDGTFGSERYRSDLIQYEAVVVGAGGLFAHAPPQRAEEPGFVTFPTLSPTEPRIARFFFRVPGAGIVLPPEAWCEAAEDRNQELLTTFVGSRPGVAPHVEMRFFLEGEYALHWQSIRREDGIFPFTFDEDRRNLDFVIDLPPAATNLVALTVVDPEGSPLGGPRVRVTSLDPAIDEESSVDLEATDDGIFIVPLVRDLAHRITVIPQVRKDLVETELTLPVGAEIASPVRLRSSTAITARVEDPSERPLDGIVNIVPLALEAGEEWPEGTMIRYGAPLGARLERGEFSVSGAAEGLQLLEFRHEATATEAKVEVTLAPQFNELDTVVLGEVRSLRGAVIEEGDIGVAGAEVMLVEPGAAFRYPGRDVDLSRVVKRVESGAGGVFSIDLTGVDEEAEYSLVARHPGHTSAVLPIVVLDGPPPTLFLRDGNELQIRAVRNGSGEDVDLDRFRLTYLSDHPAEGEIDLGEVASGELRAYFDIRPGRYRLEWGPEELPLGVSVPTAEVIVGPGLRRLLDLTVDVDIRTAIARRNGTPLQSGWVIATDDPNDPSRLYAGSVVGGVATIPVPRRATELYVSAIPIRVPEIPLDFELGSALPRELSRSALNAEPIVVDSIGYDLTFTFNENVLLSRNPVLVLPRWVFEGDEWSVDGEVTIPITESPLVIPDLGPGLVRYSVESRGPGGWSIHQSIELVDEDGTVSIVR